MSDPLSCNNENTQKTIDNQKSIINTDSRVIKRNVIQVLVKNNQLYLRNRLIKFEELKDSVKNMITNIDSNPVYPENPRKAIVTLEIENPSEKSLKVYSELKEVYRALWEEKSQNLYGKS